MKRIGLKVSTLATALMVALTMAGPRSSVAQAAGDASIHGHANNPVGQPITNGEVRMSTDRSVPEKDMKFKYTFPLDANGDYKGTGIAPGNYVVFVFQGPKSLDFNDNVAVTSGADKVVNFDMSRAEYIDKMSP